MNTLIDISRPLDGSTAVWPGDNPFQLQTTGLLQNGDLVNVTKLILSAHTGTHVDAPYHVRDDGITLDQVDLATYWGPAQVVSRPHKEGALQPEDFAGFDLTLAPRLLVRSPVSSLSYTQFPERFPVPSPALADYLYSQGIFLYGTDAPSVDTVDSSKLLGHQAIIRNGIAILEGLYLDGVEDGLYELSALPLRIMGGDGSPVRAVLRRLD